MMVWIHLDMNKKDDNKIQNILELLNDIIYGILLLIHEFRIETLLKIWGIHHNSHHMW
jgi:hypothetical protein